MLAPSYRRYFLKRYGKRKRPWYADRPERIGGHLAMRITRLNFLKSSKNSSLLEGEPQSAYSSSKKRAKATSFSLIEGEICICIFMANCSNVCTQYLYISVATKAICAQLCSFVLICILKEVLFLHFNRLHPIEMALG